MAGQQPVLTAIEYSILELLVRRSPAVVPRRSIAVNVWDDEADAMGSNTIDVHLARLRAKLAGGMVRIETVRGVGYRLVGALAGAPARRIPKEVAHAAKVAPRPACSSGSSTRPAWPCWTTWSRPG